MDTGLILDKPILGNMMERQSIDMLSTAYRPLEIEPGLSNQSRIVLAAVGQLTRDSPASRI